MIAKGITVFRCALFYGTGWSFSERNVIPGLTRNLFLRKNIEGEIPGQARYDNFVWNGEAIPESFSKKKNKREIPGQAR